MWKFSKEANVAQGLKLSTRDKQYATKSTRTTVKDKNKRNVNKDTETIFVKARESKQRLRYFSMDTTEDRPCCCKMEKLDDPNHHIRSTSDVPCVENVYSELITPMFVNQGVAQGINLLNNLINL